MEQLKIKKFVYILPIFIFAAFCISLIGAAPSAAKADRSLKCTAEAWKLIDDNMYYRSVSIKRIDEHWSGAMHQLKFDLKSWKTAVCSAKEMGKRYASPEEMRRYKGGVCAVNCSFFDDYGNTLGYIQQNGREIDAAVYPISGLLSGIFEVYQQKATLWYRDNFYPISCETAFQAGPRLADEGEPIYGLSENRERLSGIAVDKDGKIIIYSNDYSIPISLEECRNILFDSESRGGINLRYALNLDGGSSSSLYIKTGSFSLERPGIKKVPNALVIKRR